MTVQELIDRLQELPPDKDVVRPNDDVGGPVCDVENVFTSEDYRAYEIPAVEGLLDYAPSAAVIW